MNTLTGLFASRSARAVLIFFLCYIGFGAFLTLAQERFIYQPPRHTFDSCLFLPQAELTEVNGTRLFIEDISDKVLVIYQGNAGTVCDRALYAQAATNAGWSYILVSYTGYGDGAARPTHQSVRQDVNNVVAFLEEKSYQEVKVLGESIGSGVAAYHTSVLPPDALLLITPFDTLRAVAQHHYWFYPVNVLVHEIYDTVSNLADYQGSVTIVHGTSDAVIPYERGRALYDSLSTQDKTFIPVEGADHNDLWLYLEPSQTVTEFLE